MKLIQAATPSEGRVTVSNNFPKWRQHDFKIGTISTEIVIYTFLLQSAIFPYNSLYTQAVAYTTYFELGEPVREWAYIHWDVQGISNSGTDYVQTDVKFATGCVRGTKQSNVFQLKPQLTRQSKSPSFVFWVLAFVCLVVKKKIALSHVLHVTLANL